MMKRAKQKQHLFKLRHLIYLVLVTSVISSTTLARYAMEGDYGAEATIAAFVSETDLNLDLGTHGPLAPGEDEEIIFHVKNYDASGKVCEVPVDYEIQIETTGNLPLKFTLTGSIASDQTDEDLGAVAGPLDKDTRCAKGGKLPSARSGGAADHTYTLKITWPSNEAAEEYSNEIDHLSVKIKTEQAGADD